jgi:predicted aminopeptidase
MSRFTFQLSLIVAAISVLPSCQTIQFYGQAINGEIEILRKSRASNSVTADPDTSPVIRRQLEKVERLRRYAMDQLALPADECFGKYADIGRPHVVWVIYATPEFSLKPKAWSYPFIGKMDYRGYFAEQDADKLADQLRREGYDVYVGGVDAFSTLGWFHDPVLNTFINYPDIHLAETVFHELTHLKVFRRGDTVFNESLAEVVAEEGVKRWLRHEGRLDDLRKYEQLLVRRREFHQEIDRSCASLIRLYASAKPAAEMRREKAAIMEKLRDGFRELHERWGGRGLEAWLQEDINNGHIVSLKIYSDQMPEFHALLKESGGDFAQFFKAVDHLKRRGHYPVIRREE